MLLRLRDQQPDATLQALRGLLATRDLAALEQRLAVVTDDRVRLGGADGWRLSPSPATEGFHTPAPSGMGSSDELQRNGLGSHPKDAHPLGSPCLVRSAEVHGRM